MPSSIAFAHRPLCLKIGFVVALAFFFGASNARAELLDGSNLQIGPGIGTDPVQINDSGALTVTNVDNGAGNLNTPWLLILGIPNTTTTTAEITQINGSNVAPISGTYETTMNTSGQEAYAMLNIDANTNNSNQFQKWAGADLADNNLTVNSFGLFEYQIPVTLSGGGTDGFQFSSLPNGTFVIAYGISGKHEYDTPFTEAGMTTGGNGNRNAATPAPPSVVLLGFGGFGLAFILARSRRRLVAA